MAEHQSGLGSAIRRQNSLYERRTYRTGIYTIGVQGLCQIQKREQLGLRSIVPEQIQIPEISGDLENAVA